MPRFLSDYYCCFLHLLMPQGVGSQFQHTRLPMLVAEVTGSQYISSSCFYGHNRIDYGERLGVQRTRSCDACSLELRAPHNVPLHVEYVHESRHIVGTDLMCPSIANFSFAAAAHNTSVAAVRSSNVFFPEIIQQMLTTTATRSAAEIERTVFVLTEDVTIQDMYVCIR